MAHEYTQAEKFAAEITRWDLDKLLDYFESQAVAANILGFGAHAEELAILRAEMKRRVNPPNYTINVEGMEY
jgi:hypothetical protein